ncbi:hypothetical protein ACOME3_001405 [Neoechinorhynchus agilis]
MESLIGVVGDGFTLLVNDTGLIAHGVIVVQSNIDKLYELNDGRVAMITSGEDGDVARFSEYIARNVALYKVINQHELSPKAIASFARREMYTTLRSRSHSIVYSLIGGYDTIEKRSKLFAIDELGSMHEAPFTYQGFCQYFGLALADRFWRPKMNLEQALSFVNNLIGEICTRFLINNRCFFVRKISKDGCQVLDNIYPPMSGAGKVASFFLIFH